MHVLMTTDTVGGVWTYTRELAAGLLESGCELTLVTLGRLPAAEQQDWIDRARFQWPHTFRALTTQFPLEWMQNNASCYAESAQFLLNCIHQYHPDLVHSNQFCYGALPTSIPKLVVAHSDLLSWWRGSRNTAPDYSEWLATYLHLVSRGLREASIVVAPTAWMLRQIDCSYGPLPSSAVIYNGREIESQPARPRKSQAVTAGRLWDEAKNIALLASVRTQIPLLVAGEDNFDGARSELQSGSSIRTLGRLTESDLLQLLAESAIYIATSRYEPFGLAAVEAALAGCAIVANDIPSLREVWGDAAIYFERNDADSLSHTLDRIAGDTRMLHHAATRARIRAMQRYSRERMTSGYLALYSRLLRAEGTRRVA